MAICFAISLAFTFVYTLAPFVQPKQTDYQKRTRQHVPDVRHFPEHTTKYIVPGSWRSPSKVIPISSTIACLSLHSLLVESVALVKIAVATKNVVLLMEHPTSNLRRSELLMTEFRSSTSADAESAQQSQPYGNSLSAETMRDLGEPLSPTQHLSLHRPARSKRRSARPLASPRSSGLTVDSYDERLAFGTQSVPPSRSGSIRYSLDSSATKAMPLPGLPTHVQERDPWRLPSMHSHQESISRASSQRSRALGPKPKASFNRLSSLDNLITYREEKAEWKRASSTLHSPGTEYGRKAAVTSEPETVLGVDSMEEKDASTAPSSGCSTPVSGTAPPSLDLHNEQPKNKFRHLSAEIGFCFTIASTQFLAEYMISGFAIELPKIIDRQASSSEAGGMGVFWPASLLSLILSATLLIFARISDMYGGYFPFMFGVIWLSVWSLVAGFADFGALLDVSRAMQGFAIAAFIPSTFAMVGSIYPEGPRKNIVLGLYSGCAPLGFFAGFLVAGAIVAPGWYFWIAAILSVITVITAYLTVPHDRTNRKQLGLKMDWIGACLITGGLILVVYALSVEPYANASNPSRSGWSFPMVLTPLIAGLGCLVTAFWIEGWFASCPLLPFDFFAPRSIKAFSLACLCFYASYGVWLYESARFLQSPFTTGTEGGIHGIRLASWYTPTAVGGLILCIASGAILHVVPIMILLLISAMAWIAAPLLLALCPLPVSYWSYVMPSMLCATLGIDLTFTVSVVFLSSVQPLRYQGLAGAVSSILVNLAMSFALSISEIVSAQAESTASISTSPGSDQDRSAKQEAVGFRSAFIYAAASAGLGLIICVLFVRISRSVAQQKRPDEEHSTASSEASTFVDGGRE